MELVGELGRGCVGWPVVIRSIREGGIRLEIPPPGMDQLGTIRAGGSGPGGRCVDVVRRGRGKSGLHRARWWVTPTVREDRESATENIPPAAVQQSPGKGEKVR